MIRTLQPEPEERGQAAVSCYEHSVLRMPCVAEFSLLDCDKVAIVYCPTHRTVGFVCSSERRILSEVRIADVARKSIWRRCCLCLDDLLAKASVMMMWDSRRIDRLSEGWNALLMATHLPRLALLAMIGSCHRVPVASALSIAVARLRRAVNGRLTATGA